MTAKRLKRTSLPLVSDYLRLRASDAPREANPYTSDGRQRWWLAGNLVVGSPDVTADNWLGLHANRGLSVDFFRADGPFPAAPVTTQSEKEAYGRALGSAEATLPRRDSLNARIVEQVRTGTARYGETYDGGGNGIIDSPQTLGGWPELRSTAAPPDSDGDGMPDEWESRFGLGSKEASDNTQDKDKDGYTNLEQYLNGTDPTESVDYARPENNMNALK